MKMKINGLYFILLINLLLIFSCKIEEPQTPPIVITEKATDIQLKSLTLNGQVVEEGYTTATERGFVYSDKILDPSVSNNKITSGYGKGIFYSKLENLIPNTKYYYKAFATNTKGVAYGELLSVTTLDYALPNIITNSPLIVTEQSVELTGKIIDQGGSNIIESGFAISINPNPTIDDLIVKTNLLSPGVFINLKANTKYYVRSFAKNVKGTSYGNEINFTTLDYSLPSITTNSIESINYTSVKVNATIRNLGGGSYIDGGFVYSTKSLPTIYDSKIQISQASILNKFFSYNVNKLDVNTTYFIRSFLINEKGISYGNEIIFTTLYLPVVISKTGRIWMDRNLGASRAAANSSDEQSFGDLYQWGRNSDGHQKRNSSITTQLEENYNSTSSKFVINETSPNDWLKVRNDNLWQGVDGINNVCPSGFRIPTIAEWREEISSWDSKNILGAFNSKLKLPASKYRVRPNGEITGGGTSIGNQIGVYWSSTYYNVFDGGYAMSISFSSLNAGDGWGDRGMGHAVRCIKD